jgi:hypothetical protein
MNKVARYAAAYGLWIVDLGLSAWLFLITRSALIAIMAMSSSAGEFQYTKTVNLVDRIFTVVLGLGWLLLSIFTEEYYRSSALKNELFKRFARVTGPLLLVIFIIDLLIFWLQGISADLWFRWLILAAELVLGLVLVVSGRISDTNKSN